MTDFIPPFQPESSVTINGDAYVIQLRLHDDDAGLRFRYISVDMKSGNTIAGYDYIGPADL